MRAADLTTAVVLMAGGVLVIWDSLRLGVGWGTDGPKSGFFPFWLGLYVATTLYMAIYMRWIGRFPWRSVAVVSIVVSAVTFYVFEIWFLVPMPKGPLEAYFGY